jgi:hypothetical protein
MSPKCRACIEISCYEVTQLREGVDGLRWRIFRGVEGAIRACAVEGVSANKDDLFNAVGMCVLEDTASTLEINSVAVF